MTDPADDAAPATDAPARRPFQILALDGGGLKGLFSAALLSEFERDLGTTIVDHFDLITGTSTGGLIALALGAGRSPADVVDFYLDKGPSIFPTGRWRQVRQTFRSKYPNEPLRRALEEVLGDRRLGQSVKRLVDGGVWANNPSLVGVAEAVSMLGVPLTDIRVLSLGTTDPVAANADSLDEGGLIRWARPSSAVLLRAQALGHLHTAEHLVGREKVVRVDAKVPDGMFRLDRLDAPAIRGLAEGISRRCSPSVEPFTRSTAAAYRPTGTTY